MDDIGYEFERMFRHMEGVFLVCLLIALVFSIFIVACWWRIFSKAGKPGWAAIVPIYNLIVILEIVGRPLWWILLMLIPCVNIIVAIVITIDLAKSYGLGAGFAVGLLLLPIIFIPILAFGGSRYLGPAAGQAPRPPYGPGPYGGGGYGGYGGGPYGWPPQGSPGAPYPPPGGWPQGPPPGAPYPPQAGPYPPQAGPYPPQGGPYPPQAGWPQAPPQGGAYPPPADWPPPGSGGPQGRGGR